MYEDESISYENCDVHASALCLKVSSSCKPCESCVFSTSILLLRSVGKIDTHYFPNIRIICKPAAQSCAAQEIQPVAHNPGNRKDAYQK